MAEISIGNRRVQVPDDLDPKKPSAAAPQQLRGNAFGDAAARTVAPGTVTPSLTGNPIAANPGMTGNPDNARFMKEAQMRVDPVQTAARNAAWPQTPAATPSAPAATPSWMQPKEPGIVSRAASQLRAAAPDPSKWFGSAEDWKKMMPSGGANSPHSTGQLTAPGAMGKFAKGVGVVQGGVGAYDAYQGLREGDYGRAAVGGADALAAGALFTPAAPAAAVYLGARGAWDTGKAVGGAMYSGMEDSTKNTLGGTLNTIANKFGFGYDEGKKADNDIKLAQQFKTSVAAQQPGGGAAPASGAKPGTASAPTKPSAPIQFGPADGPQQPEGLRTNVTRVGNSYTGPEGVGGDIRINNQAGRGTVTMMGGNPGDLTSAQRMARDQRTHDIEMQTAVLRQQIMDRASGAPTPGVFILGGETQGSALRKQFDSTPSASILGRQGLSDRQRAADDRARERIALDERRMLMGDETQRRGQDITGQGQMLQHGAQLRGQDLVHGAALRGQDLDYAGKMAPVEAAKARREMVQRVMGSKEVGGDPVKGAQFLVSMGFGDEAKVLMEQARDKQTLGHNAAANADTRSEGSAVVRDKDGQLVVSKGVQAVNRDLRNNVAPGYDQMSEAEQAAHKPMVDAATRIVGGMNKNDRTSLAQVLRIDGPTPQRTRVPNLRDAKVDYLGATDPESWIPFNGLSRGDVRVRLQDGTDTYIPRKDYNANEMTLLEKYSK